MHKVYVTLLTALLALGPGAATASEASEPEAAKSSARNTVPTGTPQSKRDHKEEWKDTDVKSILRPLRALPSTAPINEVLNKAKSGHCPLLAVYDPERPEKFTGIVSPMDVASILFG